MGRFKFRAWDTDRKVMLSNHTFASICLTGIGVCTFLEWMQCTGLKDKNGKDIYEGDILKFSNGYDHCDYYSAVYYNAPSFTPVSRVPSEGCNWSVSVEGNIHENPELLQTEEGNR